MATTLYLIRHGATEANLARPYRLQGARIDPPLAPLGVRQAELTRDALIIRPITQVFSSPLRRALETARIIAEPRSLPVATGDVLIECDVGRWEGLTYEQIRHQDADAYRRFIDDPGRHPYPEGETFSQVAERVRPLLDRLLEEHDGQSLVVVGHHVVNRVYLAGLLGLSPSQARQVKLDNCGISVVVRDDGRMHVATLNATLHLLGTNAAA
jgi:phosphoserine phosphatase